MRMKVGVCALGMMAVSASGCAAGSATFNSAVDLKKAPSVARVFVLANVKNNAFNEALYQGFERGLRAEFTGCGVKSEVMHVNELELNPQERLAAETARFQPDSVFFIRAEGGTALIGQYGTNSDLLFDMKLFDASEEGTSYWHARSKFSVLTRNLYIDDTKSGEQFAKQIVDRLRSDGVLKGCKSLELEAERSAETKRAEDARRERGVSGFSTNDY